MIEAVLDASAILAMLNDEAGGERTRDVIGNAMVSAVNLAEVVTKLIDQGFAAEAASALAGSLPCRVAPMDASLARRAGTLRAATKAKGLSLGDRSCLALAEREQLPALTTDRAWAGLDLGVEITLLR